MEIRFHGKILVVCKFLTRRDDKIFNLEREKSHSTIRSGESISCESEKSRELRKLSDHSAARVKFHSKKFRKYHTDIPKSTAVGRHAFSREPNAIITAVTKVFTVAHLSSSQL